MISNNVLSLIAHVTGLQCAVCNIVIFIVIVICQWNKSIISSQATSRQKLDMTSHRKPPKCAADQFLIMFFWWSVHVDMHTAMKRSRQVIVDSNMSNDWSFGNKVDHLGGR